MTFADVRAEIIRAVGALSVERSMRSAPRGLTSRDALIALGDGRPGEPLRYFIAAAIVALALVLAWGVVVAMRQAVPTPQAVAEPLRESDGGRPDKSSDGVSDGVRIIRTVPIFPPDITEVRQEPAGEVSAPPAPPLPVPRRVPAANICERYHGWQEFYDGGRRWRCVFPSKRT